MKQQTLLYITASKQHTYETKRFKFKRSVALWRLEETGLDKIVDKETKTAYNAVASARKKFLDSWTANWPDMAILLEQTDEGQKMNVAKSNKLRKCIEDLSNADLRAMLDGSTFASPVLLHFTFFCQRFSGSRGRVLYRDALEASTKPVN